MNATSSNRYFPGSKGTRFSDKFLQEVAANITGKKVYKNHASNAAMENTHGVRDVDDYLGWYENGRMDKGVPRADIKYLTHQAPFVESLMEAPDKVGLSIVANGQMSYDKETGIAEAFSLKKLHSADLVTEPGSTNNMFESRNLIEEEDAMDYEKITAKELLENRPDLVEGIEKGIREAMSSKEEVANLKATIETLTEKNKGQAKQLDDAKVKEAVTAKNDKIAKLIKDSELAEEFITEVFKTSLFDAKDEEAMKALIEDRKEVVKNVKPSKQVKGAGASTKVNENETTGDEIDKAAIEAAKSRG